MIELLKMFFRPFVEVILEYALWGGVALVVIGLGLALGPLWSLFVDLMVALHFH